MTATPMNVTRYCPRFEKHWKDNGDGSFAAHVYTFAGVVEIFTYMGDDRTNAFTSLEMFIHPHEYRAVLPRHYHHRWLCRLARIFAEQCFQMAESQS